MRKLAILSALLLFVACTDEKTTTNATVGDNSTVATTTHSETTTTLTVDTAATAQAAQDTKDAARNAEHKTGTALETAGRAMQKDAKRHH